MNKKVFIPFEINDQSDTPLTEIDPDLQFYLETNYIRNTKCDYYMEDTFIKKFSTPGNHNKKLSLLDLNIKSLPRHYDEFIEYLTLLNFEFSCLGISETWLNECKEALYDIPGYVTVSKYRTDRRGGGVSLYIRHEIPFTIRHDVDCFDSEMESIFIEIDRHIFQTPSNIVIGLIYRMPDASVDIFNERITDILNIINREKKIIYLIGDLNIDLFKCESHKPTSAVLDILYSHNVFPLITKLTRVTEKTATLIDHILTNNLDVASEHEQGILCTDISDHYAIFHIAGNISHDNLKDLAKTRQIRDMRRQNIEKFTNEMQQINWNCVTDKSDAQASYSEFHRVISQKYNKCYPYRKMNKPYYNNKPWLTNAMKELIKMKNKLYIIRNKANAPDGSNERYRMYRNKLNHILRSAERKYYQDLLIEHKTTVKKSWQTIKGIINKRKYRLNNTKLKHNGAIIEDGKLVADKFNKYFVNVGESLAKSIPQSKRKPDEYIDFKTSESFYLTEVTENEINAIIGNFNTSSPGRDELKPGLIKMIKNCVKKPLTHICNRSFETSIFPSELKVANVVPIFKSGDEMLLQTCLNITCVFKSARKANV